MRVQRLAQRRVAAVAHQHLAGQHIRQDHALARQAVARRQHADDFALRQLGGDQVGMLRLEDGDGDVGVAQQQLRQQRVHAQWPVADAHAGVAGAELRGCRRDQPLAEAGAGHHADQAAAVAGQARGHVVQAVDAGLDRFHFLEQLARFLGGMQAALETLEQRIAKAQFDRCQHPADGRLGHVQQPPGRAQRARDHDGVEYLDLAQIQRRGRPDLSG